MRLDDFHIECFGIMFEFEDMFVLTCCWMSVYVLGYVSGITV